MKEKKITQVNPWIKLWTAPRATFQHILDTNPYRVIIWLALISGLLAALFWLGGMLTQEPEYLEFKGGLFIIATLIGGLILGIVQLYFGSWLYQLTGMWLGGRGNYTEVKCAVGWGMYPFIVAHLISISTLFVMNYPIVEGLLAILNIAIVIWGFIIFTKMLGQAHKFSAWKALAAFLLGLLLIFVVIMLISLLIPLLSPLF